MEGYHPPTLKVRRGPEGPLLPVRTDLAGIGPTSVEQSFRDGLLGPSIGRYTRGGPPAGIHHYATLSQLRETELGQGPADGEYIIPSFHWTGVSLRRVPSIMPP